MTQTNSAISMDSRHLYNSNKHSDKNNDRTCLQVLILLKYRRPVFGYQIFAVINLNAMIKESVSLLVLMIQFEIRKRCDYFNYSNVTNISSRKRSLYLMKMSR